MEACGILAGRDGVAYKLYEMTNVEASADHFMMAPQEQFAAVKDMRSESLEMLAIYHSHPETPARLSDEDVRLGLTPGVVHMIVSLQDPDEPVVEGFLFEDSGFVETPITVERTQQ